jgi:hypothetical protein
MPLDEGIIHYVRCKHLQCKEGGHAEPRGKGDEITIPITTPSTGEGSVFMAHGTKGVVTSAMPQRLKWSAPAHSG